MTFFFVDWRLGDLAISFEGEAEKTCLITLINRSRGVPPGTSGNFIFAFGILYPVAA
jgi:hypothetical protein